MFGTRFSSFRVIFIIFLIYFATTLFFVMRLETNYETGRELDAEDLVYFYDVFKNYRINVGKRETDDAVLLKQFLSKMHNHTWKSWEISHILHQSNLMFLNQTRERVDNAIEEADRSDVTTMIDRRKVGLIRLIYKFAYMIHVTLEIILDNLCLTTQTKSHS